MMAPEFVLSVACGVPHYRCSALADLPFVRHGFSTRRGPSAGAPFNLGHANPDQFERVEAARRRFLEALDLRSARLCTSRQVHSNRVHIIEDPSAEWNPGPEGDALATRHTGVALAVQVADCYPVLVVDPRERAIAALHAGWRGIPAGIVEETVAALGKLGCDPGRLLAAVGPGIGSCCMEVGEEVAQAYADAGAGPPPVHALPDRPGKYRLDLIAALEERLRGCGVDPGRVFVLRACTRCRSDMFFSYRAEGARAGRMMAVIGLA